MRTRIRRGRVRPLTGTDSARVSPADPMKLTVLNVAFPLTQVSADSIGGAEQVLFALDEALEAAGHRSVVIAGEGSVVRGTLLPVPYARGPLTAAVKAESQQQHLSAISRALERFPIDLVHLHGVDFHKYLPPPGPPVLATLHLPPSWYPAEVFQMTRPHTYLQCVSRAAHNACPAAANLLQCIPNGVPVERLFARAGKRDFALALGRICPEKGFHIALDAAHEAGIPLLIGGQVFQFEEHVAYFEREVAPRLPQCGRFLGPLSFQRKRRLLTAARCLLITSVVHETSSLVAMEALACGTPVVGLKSPALAEIIEPGRTGFLVSDAKEMALAIPQCLQLDSSDCRHAARQRFSSGFMTRAYLRVYQQLAGAGRFWDAPGASRYVRGRSGLPLGS